MSPRRILMLAPANSIHSLRWADFLHQQGYEIIMVSAFEPKYEFSVQRLELVSIENFRWRLPALLWQLRQLAAEVRPDLVHVHYLTYMGWLPALLNLHPLVITLWGSDILKDTSGTLARWLTRLSLRRSDLVTADAPSILDIARNQGAKQTGLILFGVNREIFYPVQDKAALRGQYGLDSDDFIVLSPRAMTALYQPELILAACRQLRQQGCHRLRLLMLEYGTTPAYREQMHALAQGEDWIRFLPGLELTELGKIYNLADVMVSIPRTDGVPVTFLEAMACGLPIISNYHLAYQGVFPETALRYIEQPSAGAETAHGLVPALTDRLAEFAAGKADRRELIAKGLEIAAVHTQEAEMGRMLDYYQQLIKTSAQA